MPTTAKKFETDELKLLPQHLRVPSIARSLDISPRTWLRWVSDGHAPRPVKLGRCTVWRVTDIQQWLDGGAL